MKAKFFATALIGVFLAPFAGSAQEVVEFEGPDDAHIYVLEGSYQQSGELELLGGTWSYDFDLATSVDVNNGTMLAMGTASLEGSGLFFGQRLKKVVDDRIEGGGGIVMSGGRKSPLRSLHRRSQSFSEVWSNRPETLSGGQGTRRYRRPK
jgi:hypothetical protein